MRVEQMKSKEATVLYNTMLATNCSENERIRNKVHLQTFCERDAVLLMPSKVLGTALPLSRVAICRPLIPELGIWKVTGSDMQV